MTTVRIATPSDTSAILDLHIASIHALGPTAYDDTQVAAWAQKKEGTEKYPVEDEDHYLVVAENGGRIVGYGHLVPKNNKVRAVYVHPDYAQQGVGSTILAHLEGFALGSGLAYLELWASLNAVQFYKQMGYRSITEETIEKEYNGRQVTLSVVVMKKLFSSRL
ncbi:GNAT family N-acetyltransferase [halophilic archaeon]|nr:GNAT family N-acetyltransferase [halophilic archaeon]